MGPWGLANPSFSMCSLWKCTREGGHVDEICRRAVLICKASMSSRSLEISQGILVAKSQQKTDRILKHLHLMMNLCLMKYAHCN